MSYKDKCHFTPGSYEHNCKYCHLTDTCEYFMATIEISNATKQRLDKFKRRFKTYDEIILHLISENDYMIDARRNEFCGTGLNYKP